MCAKRREVRRDLIEEEMIRVPIHKPTVEEIKKMKPSGNIYKPVKERKKPGRKKGWSKAMDASPDYKKPKGQSKGSVPMALPERLMPEFCGLISANGTHKRNDVINDFIARHPGTSARQAMIKFTEMTTKDRPTCVPLPGKKIGKGRAVFFYLRPRFYHMLPDAERPDGWEAESMADEVLWQEECEAKAKKKAAGDKKLKAMMEDKSAESDGDRTLNSSTLTSLTGDGDSDDDSLRPTKKQKT